MTDYDSDGPTWLNLTPHPVTIAGVELPPIGQTARVQVTYQQVGSVDGVPVVEAVYGEPSGIPRPGEGMIYVVSGLVRRHLRGRPDVVAPDTGPTAIRDSEGRILGVTRVIGPSAASAPHRFGDES